MVFILTDARNRFQGVFNTSEGARRRLHIKHGEVSYETVKGDIFHLKATVHTGQEYTIKREPIL